MPVISQMSDEHRRRIVFTEKRVFPVLLCLFCYIDKMKCSKSTSELSRCHSYDLYRTHDRYADVALQRNAGASPGLTTDVRIYERKANKHTVSPHSSSDAV